jgi:hypothetical protein
VEREWISALLRMHAGLAFEASTALGAVPTCRSEGTPSPARPSTPNRRGQAIDTRRTALNVAVPKAGPALGSPCEHDGTEEPHLEAEPLVTATLTKARRRVALGGRTEL